MSSLPTLRAKFTPPSDQKEGEVVEEDDKRVRIDTCKYFELKIAPPPPPPPHLLISLIFPCIHYGMCIKQDMGLDSNLNVKAFCG